MPTAPSTWTAIPSMTCSLCRFPSLLCCQINLLGPALLTNLLLPLLRGSGRVVNVAAAVYGTSFSANTTPAHLAVLSKHLDPVLNSTGEYFQISKYLLIHHAIELARRESSVTAISVNPGYAVEVPGVPQWLLRHAFPKWLEKKLPEPIQHAPIACATNEKGLAGCPETYAQAAAVVAVATALPGLKSTDSGVYLDFETVKLPPNAPQIFGPWQQHDPTCVPRAPPPMNATLRSGWYDEMLRLMGESDVYKI